MRLLGYFIDGSRRGEFVIVELVGTQALVFIVSLLALDVFLTILHFAQSNSWPI